MQTLEHRCSEHRPLSLRWQSWRRYQLAVQSLNWSEATAQAALRGTCFRIGDAVPVNYQFVFPGLSPTEVTALAQACTWLCLTEHGLVQVYEAPDLVDWLAQWPEHWQEPPPSMALATAQCWLWQYTHARCRQWEEGAKSLEVFQEQPWPIAWSAQEASLMVCLVDAVDGLYLKPAAIPYLGDRLCQAADALQRQTLFPPERRAWRIALLNHAARWLAAVLSGFQVLAPYRL